MVLNWDRKNNKYESIRRLPLVSAISPQFIRRREDKSVKPADLRMQQVADLVEVKMVDSNARTLTFPKSEIIKREVYTKVLKGQTMVRKLLMWKTNKDGEGSNFPAFVVHFTDFSPNRKDPLSRDMRISSSFEQIQQLFDGLKNENITKGWNLHAITETPLQSPGEAPLVPVIAAMPVVTPPVVAAADATAVAAEAEPSKPKKKATRKFAESETEAPAKAKTPRKKKSS
jgi:hypothetical protein